MPTVLLDVDGVIADWLQSTLDIIEEVTGRRYDRRQVTHWDTIQCLGLSASESGLVSVELNRPGLALSLPVLPGAKEAVRELQSIADVHFLTSPNHESENWVFEREQWLVQNGFIINPREEVTHTSAKYRVRGDYLIDDKTENLQRWATWNPAGKAILWSTPFTPYNHATSLVESRWEALIDYVRNPSKP